MTRPYTNAGKALVRSDPSLAAVVAEIEVDAVRAWLESDEAVELLADKIAEPEFDRLLLDGAASRYVVAGAILAALRREPAEVAR